jgi:hypothetical protein
MLALEFVRTPESKRNQKNNWHKGEHEEHRDIQQESNRSNRSNRSNLYERRMMWHCGEIQMHILSKSAKLAKSALAMPIDILFLLMSTINKTKPMRYHSDPLGAYELDASR